MLRRRSLAFSLLVLFPLGLHRFYLRDVGGGVAYLLASATVTGALLLGQLWLAAVIGIVEVGIMVADIVLMERRIVSVNKAIRMSVYLGQAAMPAAGYRGRVH